MGNYRFILSGGGTGGHIYPAIAIANELKKRYPDAEFLFVGARDRMEMEKVPLAGYKIEGLWISGIQRKLSRKNLVFPFKVISSLMQSGKIIKKFNPHLVIGTGGFASGPLVYMASRKGIPTVLQEQNSFAGITNKLLAGRADAICVAYDGMDRFFPAEKIIKTGNPVRGELIDLKMDKESALEFFELDGDGLVLFVMGGSLGARRINELIASQLPLFESRGIRLIWQCGALYYEKYKAYHSDRVKVLPFIQRMDYAYSLADIIISRAGAGSVSELSLLGKPVILIPSPHVAEDHQAKNAASLAERDAAIMIPETELDKTFPSVMDQLIESKERREELGRNIKKLALPDATRRIVDEIEKLLEK